MASNTCSDLIIHPVFQPFHLNATHSNISFGIALRNLANKKSSSVKSSASENHPSFSKDSTLVVQPLNVALPSQATLISQTSNEHSTEFDCIITSESSDDIDEETNQWFRPGFLNKTLSSSSPFVLHQPFEPTCWVFVLAALLLKQISLFCKLEPRFLHVFRHLCKMLLTMFQHPGMVQCAWVHAYLYAHFIV